MNDNILEPFDDVSDSTDWLSTPISGLSAVEAALRCQVCKDFYKTPMLTSCNHTFCSICIRRALSNDGKCPLCRTTEQEMKLRSNWSMEEVVTTFTKARPDVLLFARQSQEAAAEPIKRKLEETEDFESSSQPSGKRLRSSARLSKSRSMEATSEMARLEADIPDQDQSNFEPDDGLVACPICWQRMKEAQVNRHLDTSCPGEPQPQKTPSRQPSRSNSIPAVFNSSPKKLQRKNLERLPAVNYSILKEPQLRKKLSDLGISTTGNRQMLEKRHKEWMTIWNANCDSQYPRQKRELLHDLDTWERTVGSRAPISSRSINIGTQIKDKDFDGAAWAAKHDNSFKDLIANARRNKAFAVQKASKDENSITGEIQHTTDAEEGREEIGEDNPTAESNIETPTSLQHWEEQQAPTTPIIPTGVIDLTDATSPDEANRTVDLDTSTTNTTVIS
ncbi:DNA repair protein rad18 [Annulohypoxylon stygium]|nr:DNA repair protein rad18 [Annulohypoxylon stygium]